MKADVEHCVVVVSPLKSLMTDQAQAIRSRGVSVGVLTGDTTDEERNGMLSILCTGIAIRVRKSIIYIN